MSVMGAVGRRTLVYGSPSQGDADGFRIGATDLLDDSFWR